MSLLADLSKKLNHRVKTCKIHWWNPWAFQKEKKHQVMWSLDLPATSGVKTYSHCKVVHASFQVWEKPGLFQKKTTHLVYLDLKKQFFSFFKKETRFCYFFKENGKTLFITLWELGYNIFLLRFQPKTSSCQLPYQRHSSSADCSRELFKVLNESDSLLDCTRKKILWLGVVEFLWLTS